VTAEERLLDLVDGRRGHFRLESGHHGELWLDLDALFLRPARVAPFAARLARALAARVAFDAVCGPLVGGALVAHAVAAELDVELYPATPAARARDGLYTARYRIPEALRERVRGRRVAVVDDAINAGSATRATVAALRACGAQPVAVGALLVLGEAAEGYAATEQLALESVAALPNRLWEPAACPHCAAGVALDDPGGYATSSRSSG
jgi:orotate phosphoribosyltransferase